MWPDVLPRWHGRTRGSLGRCLAATRPLVSTGFPKLSTAKRWQELLSLLSLHSALLHTLLHSIPAFVAGHGCTVAAAVLTLPDLGSTTFRDGDIACRPRWIMRQGDPAWPPPWSQAPQKAKPPLREAFFSLPGARQAVSTLLLRKLLEARKRLLWRKPFAFWIENLKLPSRSGWPSLAE